MNFINNLQEKKKTTQASDVFIMTESQWKNFDRYRVRYQRNKSHTNSIEGSCKISFVRTIKKQEVSDLVE